MQLKFREQQIKLKWLVFLQMKKIVPLITSGIPFSQHVCELVFGVNVPNVNFRIEINPVKQRIQSNSVGS